MSETPNGVFKLGSEVLRAVRQPGVDREAVTVFRDLTSAVREGNATADEAAAELSEVSLSFASLLKAANENPAVLTVLFGLLQMILAYWTITSSDASSIQAHEDAQAQLEATKKQTQAIESAAQSQSEIVEAIAKIDDEVQKLNEVGARPTKVTPRSYGEQTVTPLSRQQRRHAERQAVKAAKRRPFK